jgi:uncharacterized DUF497 family protein
MKIEFDPDKRNQTLKDRGLDFACAAQLFEGLHMTGVDDRKNYSETRFVTVGHLENRLIVVAWTQRGQARRIISMRKANDREKIYFQTYTG